MRSWPGRAAQGGRGIRAPEPVGPQKPRERRSPLSRAEAAGNWSWGGSLSDLLGTVCPPPLPTGFQWTGSLLTGHIPRAGRVCLTSLLSS